LEHSENTINQLGETFIINTKCIRNIIKTGRIKSIGPDGVPGEILTLYLARLLEMSLNNVTIPSDWKKSHIGSCLQRELSIASHKLQTHKLTLCGLQAPGTRYSRVFEASLGQE
jgi:ABC-type enterochelin transport system ATPase subunit